MAGQVVRVLVCDDSFGFPALVGSWLDDDARFEHLGTAHSGTELLERARREERVEAVVLDLVIPDVPNPTALVTQLRELQPGVRILLVSSLRVHELERAASAAGVDAFVHKSATRDVLLGALAGMAGG